MLVPMDPEWLYRFEQPGEAQWVAIRNLLEKLAVVSGYQAFQAQRHLSDAISGDLDFIVQKLTTVLAEDYLDNDQERENVPYHFDYVVMPDTMVPGALGIYTRFYTRKEPGNVYYGCTVLRAEESLYYLWTE